MTSSSLVLDIDRRSASSEFANGSRPAPGLDDRSPSKRLRLSDRATLFTEGERAAAVFYIESGAVALTRTTLDGRRQVLEILGPDSLCGLVTGKTYTATAETLAPTVALNIERTAIESSDHHQRNLARHLMRKVERFQHHTARLGRMSAVERVADFLLELPPADSTLAGSKTGKSSGDVRISPTQVDIADYLSLTHETISRTMAAFKRAGIIATPSRRRVTILDEPRLRALVLA